MNPALLAALITQVGVPEMVAWLHEMHAARQPLTDADVIKKLFDDTAFGDRFGDWLAANPPTPKGAV